MNKLARTAANWLSHVAGPQPNGQVEEDIEDDDLNALNYLSPRSQERRSQRQQRASQENASRRAGREVQMQRTNATARSAEASRLLKPRAGDRADSGGTPLQRPSDSSSRPVARSLHQYGGIRPRNDFSGGGIGGLSAKKTTGLTGRNANWLHAPKRRKIEDANTEGDGFERSRYFEDSRRNDPIWTGHGTREGNRGPLNSSMILERHRTYVEDSLGEDDFDVDSSTENARKWPRGDEDSDIGSEAATTKKRRKDRISAHTNGQHESGRSSPDVLGAGSDPVGAYEAVHYFGNSRNPRQQQESPPRDNGFKLEKFRHPKLELHGPGLQLVPKNGATTYEMELYGQDVKFVLRKKEIVHCSFHNDSHAIILKLRPKSSTELPVVMWFAQMRDRIAFFAEFADALSDKLYERSTKASLEHAASSDLKTIQVELEGEAPSRYRLSFDSKHQNKLKDKLKGPSGESRYHAGNIDRTIRNVRLEQVQAAIGVRRSARTPKPIQSSKEILDLEDETTNERDALQPLRYSETHGLGKKWKEDLIWPSTGKNRVSVTWDSLPKLDAGQMLNDELVNFYLRFLEIRMHEANPEAAKRVYWFNTFFYEQLTNLENSKQAINYNAVKRTTRKVDLFDFDYVVVPIHEKYHWYVAIICNLPAINRKAPEFVELSSSEANAGNIDAEDQTVLIPEDPALVMEGKVGSMSPVSVDLDHDEAIVLADNAKEDATSAYHASGAATPHDLNGTLIFAQTPATNSSSQLTDDSLVERKLEQPAEILRSSDKSVDEIFDPVSAQDDHDSVTSRLVTDDREGEATALRKLMQDLEQHSGLPKAPTLSTPTVQDHYEAKPAVSKENEISPLPDSPQSSATRKQAQKSFVRRKGKKNPPVRRYDPQQPSIVTLDSLGGTHSIVASKLKQYLVAEAYDKRGGMEVDIKEIQGITGKGIPQQPNWVDCGVYVLGYMDKFADDPKHLVTRLLQKTLDPVDDWPQFNADNMRDELRKLILQKHEEQIGVRREVKELQELAKPAGRQFSLSNPSDPDSQEPSRLQQNHGHDASSSKMASGPVEVPNDAPVAPTEALANAQLLEDISGNQTPNASVPVEEEARQETDSVETDTREPFQLLDSGLDTRPTVQIQVPNFSPPSNTQIISDMPVEQSAAEWTFNDDAGSPHEEGEESPPRPKSRGKSLGPAKLPGKKISKLKDKQSKIKDIEQIVLDD